MKITSEISFILLCLFAIKLCQGENKYCQEAVDSVETVTSCPTSKLEWDIAANKKNCNRIAVRQNCSAVEKFQYHCVINAYRNRLVEVCAPTRLIFKRCVEFNVGGGVIQDQRSAPCNKTFPKCDGIYNSSDAYKYPDCYKLVCMGDMISPTAVSKINTTVNVTVTTISTEDEPNSALSVKTGIAAVFVTVVLLIFIGALVAVFRCRRLWERKQNVEHTELLSVEEGNGQRQSYVAKQTTVPVNEAQKSINCKEKIDLPQKECENKAFLNAKKKVLQRCRRDRTYSA